MASTKVRVVANESWCPEGQMLVVDAKAIVAAPQYMFDRDDLEQPDKIILCHNDADALRVKLQVEDQPDMELID